MQNLMHEFQAWMSRTLCLAKGRLGAVFRASNATQTKDGSLHRMKKETQILRYFILCSISSLAVHSILLFVLFMLRYKLFFPL